VRECRKRTLFACYADAANKIDAVEIMRGSIICGKFTQQEVFPGITYLPE
jgi:hypothetical protein